MAVNIQPPRPGMQGRELEQWLDRMYQAVAALSVGEDVVVIDHNDLSNNGGDSSHATISSHMSNGNIHASSSTPQSLSNKTINADENTLSNLRHGEEVDNPISAHGVLEIIGASEAQTLTNKKILLKLTLVSHSPYLVTETDQIVRTNLNGGRITFPRVSDNTGRILVIANRTETSETTLGAYPGDTIHGEATQPLPQSSTEIFFCDGSEWRAM